MSLIPFELILSKPKWRKVALLRREAWMVLKHRVGADQSDNVPSINPADTPAPETHEWVYQAQSQAAAEVIEKSTGDYTQDELIDGSLLQTELTYQLSLLHNACMYTNGTTHLSVYDANGDYQHNFSTRKYVKNRSAQLNIGVKRHVSGLTASLYGNVENAAGNYGHWLIDGISRFFLIQKHYAIDDIDHFLIPVLKYDFQKDSLLSLGIPEEKLIEMDTLNCMRFERLVCSTAPRGYSSCTVPGWLIDGYREAYLKQIKPETTGRKIYISRRDAGSRKFVNEDEIIRMLEARGFEALELSDYSFAEKIKIFAGADAIVSLIGAGMTNVMFCPPHAKVLELHPSSFVNYLYMAICGYLGIDYKFIIFENDEVLSHVNRYHGNLSLAADVIESKLDEFDPPV